jgi:hypothetical protein
MTASTEPLRRLDEVVESNGRDKSGDKLGQGTSEETSLCEVSVPGETQAILISERTRDEGRRRYLRSGVSAETKSSKVEATNAEWNFDKGREHGSVGKPSNTR